MKTQGFTLIELLAVIVILAIIALIATPIVLGIIDDTKESAQIRSAEMYLKGVANAVMKENLEQEGNFKPTECTITSEGNLDCDDKEGILEVEVDGEKPKNGTITFEEGKIKEVTLEYTNSTIVKNEEGNLVYSDEQGGSGTGSEGEETLAPGAYYTDGSFKDWETLKSEGRVTDTSIESYAFEFDKSKENMVSFVIPDFVDTIGQAAFINCTNLKSIYIPDSIKYIEYMAFSCCESLESIIIPGEFIDIGESAFGGCENLKSITFSNSVINNIRFRAFDSCTSLETINYNGTKEQWNSIPLEWNWNFRCQEITIHCTDGDISIAPGESEL